MLRMTHEGYHPLGAKSRDCVDFFTATDFTGTDDGQIPEGLASFLSKSELHPDDVGVIWTPHQDVDGFTATDQAFRKCKSCRQGNCITRRTRSKMCLRL